MPKGSWRLHWFEAVLPLNRDRISRLHSMDYLSESKIQDVLRDSERWGRRREL